MAEYDNVLLKDIFPPEWLKKKPTEIFAYPQKSLYQKRSNLPGKHYTQSGTEFRMVQIGLWNQISERYRFATKKYHNHRTGLEVVEKNLRQAGAYLASNTLQLIFLEQQVTDRETAQWELTNFRQNDKVLSLLGRLMFTEQAQVVKAGDREGICWPRISVAKVQRRAARIQKFDDERLTHRANVSRQHLVQRQRNLRAHISSLEHHPLVEEILYEYVTGEPLYPDVSEVA